MREAGKKLSSLAYKACETHSEKPFNLNDFMRKNTDNSTKGKNHFSQAHQCFFYRTT